MKLKQIFKLKFNYLLNRNTIIILIINIFLLISFLLIEVINNDKELSYNEIINNYVNNSLLYIKILLTFFSIYLFSYSISFKNDFLVYILIPLGVKRSKSLIISIFLNIIIILTLILIIFICFSYIGLFNKLFYIKQEYVYSFNTIFLIIIIYGLYTNLLMQTFNNNFVIIIMMTLFILTQNIASNELDSINKIILLLFPNTNEIGIYFYSNWYLLYLNIILIILNIHIYNNRDLNF